MQKRGKYIGIVALIIIVIAGILYLRHPARLAHIALENATTATSHKFTTSLTLANVEQTQSILGEDAQIKLNLDGAYQLNENQPSAIGAKINATIVTDSVTVTLTGETRLLEDSTYLFIEKSPPLFPILQKLKGQWIKLPRGQYQAPEITKTSSDKLLTKVKSEGNNLYTAQASQAAVIGFMDNLAQLLGTNLTSDQIDTLKQGTTEVATVPVELEITPFSNQLKQLKSTLTIPGGNNIELNIALSNRNKPVQISSPENSITLEQAVKNLQQN